MSLRLLTPDDWAVFKDLRIEMLSTEPPAFGSLASEWQGKSEREVRDWLEEAVTIAFFEGPQLQGTAAYFREPGVRSEHRGFVVSVYLRPEVRGNGHGDRLMAALADAARANGLEQLELQVVVGNDAAFKTYQRAGYHSIGIIPRSMKTPERYYDEHVMVCDLTAAGKST